MDLCTRMLNIMPIMVTLIHEWYVSPVLSQGTWQTFSRHSVHFHVNITCTLIRIHTAFSLSSRIQEIKLFWNFKAFFYLFIFCDTVGACRLPVLNPVVCTCQSQTPNLIFKFLSNFKLPCGCLPRSSSPQVTRQVSWRHAGVRSCPRCRQSAFPATRPLEGGGRRWVVPVGSSRNQRSVFRLSAENVFKFSCDVPAIFPQSGILKT